MGQSYLSPSLDDGPHLRSMHVLLRSSPTTMMDAVPSSLLNMHCWSCLVIDNYVKKPVLSFATLLNVQIWQCSTLKPAASFLHIVIAVAYDMQA